MKSKELNKTISQKDIKSLSKLLNEQHLKLYEYRFKAKFRNLKDTSLIKKTRKNIARIYNQLNKKINTN